ncbi:HK97 family phage prohead protease [Sporolactobacillus shoreicorticis]|uniref:HK97 family phage prohead protease n=1 Tax=Sporolactobacillus shoreicorticis TaxID=1923877 RepID=A0ABW5S6A9_9BACL|nr:HK97 family phage prohead protease [Sporolactobacillus shoreicorticis]MCO7126632.1 HK97 family phage prohead protease [Sporolactobacillus shoreicorticis]
MKGGDRRMREIRTVNFEMRALTNQESNQKVISGYALEFNTLSDDLGGFRETLSQTCLQSTDLSDVRCLFNHDPNMILGRTGKNLELTIDQKGLYFSCTLPDRDYANNVYQNIQDGLINQCSFGFVVADGGEAWSEDGNGDYIRTITNIAEIFDVSPVTVPAYRQTSVEAAQRSLNIFKQKQSETRNNAIKLAKIKLKLAELDI